MNGVRTITTPVNTVDCNRTAAKMTAGAGKGYYDICKDPWNAEPAGVADEFSMPTVAMRLKSAFTLNSNNVGACGIGFQAGNLDTGFSVVPTITVGTTTVTAFSTYTKHADYDSLNAIFGYFRPISVGVKVYYIGAESTTAGLITLGSFPISANGIGNGLLPADISDWNDLPGTKTIAPAAMTEPFCLATHSYDRPSFRALGSDLASGDFFPVMLVGGTGLAVSTNVLRVEVTLNVELIPLLTTFQSHQRAAVVEYDPIEIGRVRRLPANNVGQGEDLVVAERSSGAKRARVSRGAPKKRSRVSKRSLPPMMQNYRKPAMSRRYPKRRKIRRKRKLYRRR